MSGSQKELIVVTDLDGTLLDHHDYSFDEVLPILDRMDAAGAARNLLLTRGYWSRLWTGADGVRGGYLRL